MGTTLCLLSCLLAVAQSAVAAEWPLAPRLTQGQELVYSGSYTEEARGRGTQFSHTFRIENRVIILDTVGGEARAAFLTLLKSPGGHADPNNSALCSVRLEQARVSALGRINFDVRPAPAIALDGPTTVESECFLEMPRRPPTAGGTWEVNSEGAPAQVWRSVGTEAINGTNCLKLAGLQQSSDWDRPRADRTAWRRHDTVWVAMNSGLVYRVDRHIERREPARAEPSQHSTTTFTLESRIVYPSQLFEDRQREILLFRSLSDAAAPLLHAPETNNLPAYEALQAKIAHHCDKQPETPYRGVLRQFQRRLASAARGEVPAAEIPQEAAPVATIAALEHVAPDFVATDLTTKESARLHHFLGKPVVLVFYSPTSRTAPELLRFVKSLSDAQGQDIHVFGLVMSDDTDRVLRQRTELGFKFPVLSGQGLRVSYGVDATPKLVVLDAEGVVRGAYVGWGKETADLVTDDLKHCLLAPTEGK